MAKKLKQLTEEEKLQVAKELLALGIPLTEANNMDFKPDDEE